MNKCTFLAIWEICNDEIGPIWLPSYPLTFISVQPPPPPPPIQNMSCNSYFGGPGGPYIKFDNTISARCFFTHINQSTFVIWKQSNKDLFQFGWWGSLPCLY